MDSKKISIKSLIGKDLKSFKIVEMIEIFRVDEDGRKSRSLGFFKNPDVAVAFASAQVDANWHLTQPKLVLTDGNVSFVIDEQGPAKFFNNEKETVALREKAIAKLFLADHKIFGFKE